MADKEKSSTKQDELVMKFDPNTIKHLGIQMYTTLNPVIAEVIANSYDADAENVRIYLNDEKDKEITIEDDGHGMTFEEINDKFLLIGRNRRDEEKTDLSPEKRRPVIGKKGIGKLSFFGIANVIRVSTVRDKIKNEFVLDLGELEKSREVYKPKVIHRNEKVKTRNGTRIVMSELKRKSAFEPKKIAESLARYCSIIDENNFNVEIIHNNDNEKSVKVKTELVHEEIGIEFSWDFPLKDLKTEYEYANEIRGKIISCSKPVPSQMRGIALFSRGKLVNEYSFYEEKATSHGYSYLTGHLDVSFIDKWEKDVISTNRRSLNWEDEDTLKLRDYLTQAIGHVYKEQRKLKQESKKKKVEEKIGLYIDEWIDALPKHDGKLARKMVNAIINSEEIETDKAGELVTFVKDSFQFESFKEFAAEIEEIKNVDSENIIKLLKDWQLIEAREFYKLSIGRIETIKKFEKYIKEKVREVPTMHNFLKTFPWLLDPRIIEFKDEVYYSQLLKEKYPDSDEELESNRRIDFLCVGLASNFFIIELKKPGQKIRKKDIDQASDYRTFIENQFGNDPQGFKQIVAYVVCGERSDDRVTKEHVETYEKAGKIYVKTYGELLVSAKNYHREFIERYDQMQKIGSRS